MILFQDEDEHYLDFLQAPAHQEGFVLNTTRTRSQYAVLHRATCHTIQGVPTGGLRWTTGDYRKIWAATIEELQHWAATELREAPIPCGVCHPEKDSAEEHSAEDKRPGESIVEGDPSKPPGDVVIELAAEGGGQTIFRRQTETGWMYWSEGSTIDFDEEDVDYFRQWSRPETADLASLLPSSWPRLSPLQIHPDCREWFRQSYDLFLKGLSAEERKQYEAFGSRRQRWAKMLGVVDAA